VVKDEFEKRYPGIHFSWAGGSTGERMANKKISHQNNLPEIKNFLSSFIEENWGSDRARGEVDYYASRLTISVLIVDENGRADRNLLNPSMKREMESAANDLKEELERRFDIVMKISSLSGNLLTLEKWDKVGSDRMAAVELVRIAKDLVSMGQKDRELFRLYSKYSTVPYFEYVLEIRDSMNNISELLVMFFIRHAEFIEVEYRLRSKSNHINLSLSNLQMKGELPEVKAEIDDELEEKLLAATNTTQREKVMEFVIGRDFVSRISRVVNTGVAKVWKFSTESF
ncbi:MAG: hypothetical protein ABFD50_16090, partial [Smithella sp.]